MIKTDPSQTKTIAVLLVVLAGAVVVTVLRIHPDSTQPAAGSAAAATATTRECAMPSVTVTAGPTSRNPFRKPPEINSALSRQAEQGIDFGTTSVQEGKTAADGMKYDLGRVAAMPPGAVGETRPAEPDGTKTEETKPQFALLTTVSGPNGLTAVIRIGDSATRVVTVGDTIDGYYKVTKLEQGRAVLRNGSDVIEVKRPG